MASNTLDRIPWFKNGAGTAAPVNGLACWSDLCGPPGGDVFHVFWCPFEPGALWAGTYAGDIYRRTGQNSQWQRCRPPLAPRTWISAMEAVHRGPPRILVAGGNGGLAGTDDSGLTWRDCSSGLAGQKVQVLKSHPIHPQLVLAGTRSGLYLSPDGGISWSIYPVQRQFGDVTAIAFHPSDPLCFFIAEMSGSIPAVHKTIDGGQSFQLCFNGAGHSIRIHSLVITPDKGIWIAGFGSGSRLVFSDNLDAPCWTVRNNGLISTRITALACTDDGQIWAGTGDAGIFAFRSATEQWQSGDADPARRSVKFLSSRGNHLAAGCIGGGVAVLASGSWVSLTDRLYARHISAIATLGSTTCAVSDQQLFTLKPETAWIPMSHLNNVQAVAAGSDAVYLADKFQGVFKNVPPATDWDDLRLPESHVLFIASSRNDPRIFALTETPDGCHVLESSGSTPGTWQQLGDGITGPWEYFGLACGSPPHANWVAVSSAQGIHSFDRSNSVWLRSSNPHAGDCRAMAASQCYPNRLFAGAGRLLIVSMDGGRSFESYYLRQFPSRITALSVTGDVEDTVMVGTEGGGVYVAYLPGYWLALNPEESGVTISGIHADSRSPGTYVIGTNGMSCLEIKVPTLQLELESISGNQVRVYLSISNPCAAFRTDFYLVQLPPDGDPEYYEICESGLKPSPSPVCYTFTMPAATSFSHQLIGTASLRHPASVFFAGLFEPGTVVPQTGLTRASPAGTPE